jgi:hypothetical protein
MKQQNERNQIQKECSDEMQARRKKLNQETARIPWQELLRQFAAGNVLWVSDELDLIEVALRISLDDSAQVQEWLAQQQLGKVSDAQAQAWLDQAVQLWAVVVNPWVLVQQNKPTK